MQDKDFDALLNNLNEKNLEHYVKTHLSDKKQAQLQDILNDKKKLHSVLHSKQAKQIMQRLKDRENGKH